MKTSMLTLIAAECVHCGSTAEAVKRDRLLVSARSAVCCDSIPRRPADAAIPGSEPTVVPEPKGGLTS
jgi:hypothetical protein